MPTITNKSFVFYEVTQIKPTGKSITVYAGTSYGAPVFLTRKAYENPEGRMFVAHQGNFTEVVPVSDTMANLVIGAGHFERGEWHFEDELGWVRGPAPVAVAEEEEPAEDVDDATGDAVDDGGEFNLFDLFFAEG